MAATGAGMLAASRGALALPAAQRADIRAGDTVRAVGTPALGRFAVFTTDLGSLYAVCGATVTLAALGRREMAAEVAAVGAAGWLISQASKTSVRRQRPYEAQGTARLIRPPTGTSFPSGHAAVATAVGAVLARQPPWPVGAALLGSLGPYVALSRVYVGVHYPTDVVGGAGLGLLLAAAWRGRLARGGNGAVARVAGGLRRLRAPAWRMARAVVIGRRR